MYFGSFPVPVPNRREGMAALLVAKLWQQTHALLSGKTTAYKNFFWRQYLQSCHVQELVECSLPYLQFYTQ